MPTWFAPAEDGDRPILRFTFPNITGQLTTTSVAVTVLDVDADAAVATTAGTAVQSTVDGEYWLYDTADITGINLETVAEAQLLITAVATLSSAETISRSQQLWVNGARKNLDAQVSSRATQAQILSDANPFPGANVDAAISSRATQAQILSDANPFPGANIDATISSRATQAQILSDATPFAGANIDAAISSRATPAQVNAEVDLALSDIGLDHLISAAVLGTDVADNSIIAKLVSSSALADWDTFINTTDSLQAIRDQGDAAWITAVGFAVPGDAMDLITDAVDANAVATSGANEIRDAILSDSIPFPGANVDAAISSRATQAQILSDLVPFPGSNVDAAISSRATQAQILSDLAPFPGANVDAAISSRATQSDILSDATPFPGASVPRILDLLEATSEIDQSTNPWEEKWIRQSDATTLIVFELYDENLAAINNANPITGKRVRRRLKQ